MGSKAPARSDPGSPLDQPLQWLKGVGPKLAEKLARLGLHRVGDLLFHLPLRYQDRTRVAPLGALRPGMEVTVVGEVAFAEVVMRRRRMLVCQLKDGSGKLELRFFHFSEAQRRLWRPGAKLRCFGEVRSTGVGNQMIHPEVEVVGKTEPALVEETLTPVYPATEGVHQLTLRRLSDQALAHLDQVEDWLGERYLSEPLADLSLADALRYLHRPPPDADQTLLLSGEHPARQRLAFEELLAHQLALRKLRLASARLRATPLTGRGGLEARFLAALPFALTAAQQRVADEIAADLQNAAPMMRLVQGDVGSGKTVVAALACLRAAGSGWQSAIMAPTEILAEQHYQTLSHWFEPLGLRVAWVSGRLGAAQRRETLAAIAGGEARIVVGTHALFQDDVRFSALALVVIDEQHRFGVHQRMALRDKGRDGEIHPHQLIMTATPIPRTLAQTAYADLDLSVIDELPPGRQPVKTVVLAEARRAEVVERVAAACREGRQCYWVCTLIEESEALEAQAAEDTAAALAEALPDLAIGLAHGRMKGEERDRAMQAFKAGDLDLLVATTVIEVGVDVPNASLMVIENAERLGLSQLHQLRGRVGRGDIASTCVLMYSPPLSEQGRRRLAAMRETRDGFRIAQIDMEIRGPGELLGTRQTGLISFRVADIVRDKALIGDVSRVAARIVGEQPGLADRLIRRWQGDKARYRLV
ncbi:MAG TPA: ATP-dependent DNA helicase RecG [Gammaproteobacteria bacterium]|nr:ATP-dependent DNA helicase RecG [Gammaproteobacteria bacterium]